MCSHPPRGHRMQTIETLNAKGFHYCHHVMTRYSLHFGIATRTSTKCWAFLLNCLEKALVFVGWSQLWHTAVPLLIIIPLLLNVDLILARINVFKCFLAQFITVRCQLLIPIPCLFFLALKRFTSIWSSNVKALIGSTAIFSLVAKSNLGIVVNCQPQMSVQIFVWW